MPCNFIADEIRQHSRNYICLEDYTVYDMSQDVFDYIASSRRNNLNLGNRLFPIRNSIINKIMGGMNDGKEK